MMKFFRGHFLHLAATMAAMSWAGMVVAQQNPTANAYDLVLRNARVVDGTGSPWYRADLAIRGDTIVRIAPSIRETATRMIDLGDLVAAPGFIDIHTHASRNIFEVPTADNYIRQGVTTVMEGADGGGSGLAGGLPVPLKPFLDRLEVTPRSINVASFVGQGAVREAVMGLANRAPSADELERMREIVRQSMKDGAFGLSTGLFYVPGAFTPLEEVVELQKVVAPFRGVHTSHMRDEASRVVESVKETIAIGELGGVPTHVSHHKIVGKVYWGKSVETLKVIEAARSRNVDVTMDQYPYTASSSTIQASLLPQWAMEGGIEGAKARLKEPATRARIKAATIEILLTERGGGDPKNVVIVTCDWNAGLAGKHLGEITQIRGLQPTLENAAEAVLWLVESGGCRGVFHAMGEEDLERILAHPATMIASDGEVTVFGRTAPHPRSYGTFARILSHYVREKKIITLEDAIRKMSSFPAARVGIVDRGVLRPGMKADIAVFDPARVRDMATFDKPHQYAEGYSYVIVNGQIVYESGAMTSARPGRVIYGPGKNSSVQ
jgi:dihydroorotase/N-acyl-D-amino-acid deacylase